MFDWSVVPDLQYLFLTECASFIIYFARYIRPFLDNVRLYRLSLWSKHDIPHFNSFVAGSPWTLHAFCFSEILKMLYVLYKTVGTYFVPVWPRILAVFSRYNKESSVYLIILKRSRWQSIKRTRKIEHFTCKWSRDNVTQKMSFLKDSRCFLPRVWLARKERVRTRVAPPRTEISSPQA